MNRFDSIVVGAGIAGASAAWALAARGAVLLVEREDQPGYHSTGRSAAVYAPAYGNAVIRGLTAAGGDFFHGPPKGFVDEALLSPRGFLFIGRDDQVESLAAIEADGRDFTPSMRWLTADETRDLVPALSRDYLHAAVLEPEAKDIDVHALHQGFLRGMRELGGQLVTNAEVLSLTQSNGHWQIETKAGSYAAPVVVNAAGAWCDEIAKLAGAKPVGLVPKRRTAFLFDPGEFKESASWPVVIDADEEFYFKPDAGKLLGSLADETPSPPCDARPDEYDLALAVDRIQNATDFKINRPENSWAGLRSFVSDKSLVAGYDPDLEGFFWLAGQGGYGIQTSPAMARVVSALVGGEPLPADIEDKGVTREALSPARFEDREER